jgi:hypothetical protein
MNAVQFSTYRIWVLAVRYVAVGTLAGLVVGYLLTLALRVQSTAFEVIAGCTNFGLLVAVLAYLIHVNRVAAAGRADADELDAWLPEPRQSSKPFAERLANYLRTCHSFNLSNTPPVASYTKFPCGMLATRSHPPKAGWWIRLLLQRVQHRLLP